MATQGMPVWSTSPAGNATADPNINWAEGMAPSAVNDQARATMAGVALWRDDFYGVTAGLATGGTSTAYTASTNCTYATSTALNGAIFSIVPHVSCGINPTLNVDGLGAKLMVLANGATPLAAGALSASAIAQVQYVKTLDRFIVKDSIIQPVGGLDISGATSTQVGSADQLPVFHVSSGLNYKVSVVSLFAGLNTLDSKSTPDGASDYTVIYDSTGATAKKALLSTLPPSLPRGFIDGCTIANNATDSTNDINVSSGKCRDATDTVDIVVPTLSGKQLDANWAAGGSAGMRDSGAGIANTTYGLWAVRTAASSTGDIYATTHSTASTVITALNLESGGGSYAYARRVASIIRKSGAILPFTQDHDWFFCASTTDYNTTAGQVLALTTLTVPTNIVVRPLLSGAQTQNTTGAAFIGVAPATNSASSEICLFTTIAGQSQACNFVGPPTNTSAQIYLVADPTGGVTLQKLGAHGWIDARGKDA